MPGQYSSSLKMLQCNTLRRDRVRCRGIGLAGDVADTESSSGGSTT